MDKRYQNLQEIEEDLNLFKDGEFFDYLMCEFSLSDWRYCNRLMMKAQEMGGIIISYPRYYILDKNKLDRLAQEQIKNLNVVEEIHRKGYTHGEIN